MEVKYHHDPQMHNTTAAREVVPIVMELVKPLSVIDVGCGIGTWLSVFQQAGAKEILGVDGEYVDRMLLHISEEHFVAVDLIQPFRYDKKFDLVVSLEVAEHLPESAADTLVGTLVSLGNTILFSAAIPGQGGQNHLNEQWPGYWQEKFSKHGFHFHDAIRQKIWHNPNIEWWYRQNLYLVTNRIDLPRPIETSLDVIHPEMMKHHMNGLNLQLTHTDKVLNDNVEGIIGIKQSMVILRKAIARKLFHND